MWPFTRKKEPERPVEPLTLRRAMEELDRIGVTLAPGVTMEDVLPSLEGGLDDVVDPTLLLCVLGGEAECSDAGLLSHGVWHLDAECIEDDGAYVALAERFRVLAGDTLPISEVTDHVDIEAGEAWLEFTLAGQRVHWDLAVDNDWMDPALYTNFQKLVAQRSSGRFMITALGQDSLVLFGSDEKRRAIAAFSGMAFTWE